MGEQCHVAGCYPESPPHLPLKLSADGRRIEADTFNPTVARYLNRAAFSDPALFTLGNVSVLSTVRGCGYFDEDLGVDKGFPFGEEKRVSVGAYFTNLFNRHQFLGLNSNIDSPGFGTFTSSNFPRTVQLYVKVTF